MTSGARQESPAEGALPAPVQAVIEAIDEHKGADGLVLDLRPIAGFTDYLVICTGRVERHVQTIVDEIVEGLGRLDVKPLHIEGYRVGRWVLIDVVDIVVTVFTPEARGFYQLEKLWRDAPVIVDGRDAAAQVALPGEPPVESPRPAGSGGPPGTEQSGSHESDEDSPD